MTYLATILFILSAAAAEAGGLPGVTKDGVISVTSSGTATPGADAVSIDKVSGSKVPGNTVVSDPTYANGETSNTKSGKTIGNYTAVDVGFFG